MRFRLRHRHAVEDHFVFEIDAAVNAFAKRAAGDTGGQKHELVDLTATPARDLVGQLLHHAILNGRVQVGLGSIQGDDVRTDFHGLADVARFERRIHRRSPADLDAYAVQNRGLKARQFHLHGVSAGNQVGNNVSASTANGCRLYDARSHVRDGHFRIRRQSAGRVGDGTVDAAQSLR